MTGEMLIALVSRWLHVLAAVVAVGGAFFMRFVLMPTATSVLSTEEHERLRTPLLKRWTIVVHSSILVFLLTGFYNYLAITRFEHEGQPLYHALFGIKFLLALCVFALAIALTSRSEAFAAIRANSRWWLAVLVVLGIMVVMLGGVMRSVPAQRAGAAVSAAQSDRMGGLSGVLTPAANWPRNTDRQ
jgi:uncharacterized membrane protein